MTEEFQQADEHDQQREHESSAENDIPETADPVTGEAAPGGQPQDQQESVRPLTARPQSAEEIRALDRALNAAVEGAGTRALWSAVLASLPGEALDRLREYVAHKELREYALGARAALRAVRPLVTERDQQLAQATKKLRQLEHERQRLQAEVERLRGREQGAQGQDAGRAQRQPRQPKQGGGQRQPKQPRQAVRAPQPPQEIERPTWDYPEQPVVRQRGSVTEASESVLITARAIEAYLQLRGEVAQSEVVSAHEAYTESGAALKHLRLSGRITVLEGMISVTERVRELMSVTVTEG